MTTIRRAPAGGIVVTAPDAPCRYDVDAEGRIQAVGPAVAGSGEAVTLGLVDLQVNGFAGVDFNADGLTAAAFDGALAAMLASGVTRCLPTIITAGPERLRARLAAIDAAIRESRLGPWMVEGLHLEGPFLSPEDGYAGCHPKDAMRPPSIDTFDDLTAGLKTPVRLVTVAPERDGAIALIEALASRGIRVAIGHTNATRAEIERAIAAGARLSTHLGNGIGHQLVKNENPLFAQLGEDRLAASFIADGIHIPPYMLQSWIRAKQLQRTVLVTDATAAAAAEPGLYTLGDLGVERGADGVVREPGSPYLAGSSATLDGCLRNVMRWFGYDFATAFALARGNPLSVLGRPTTPSRGDVAEFVRWHHDDDGWHVVGAHVGRWVVDV